MNGKEYKPTVVFDFDGVIHSYKSGWKGAGVIPDPVVPGIVEAIDHLRAHGYRVVVVSTRCSSPEGMEAVKKYLAENQIIVDGVLAEKPPAICYVDDRAICFRGNSGKLADQIKNFKSWVEDPQLQLADCTEIRVNRSPLTDKEREEVARALEDQRYVLVECNPHPTEALRPCRGTYYDKGERREVIGRFHGWADEYEEFEAGPGNTTFALVEDETGQIFPCAMCVRFLDR